MDDWDSVIFASVVGFVLAAKDRAVGVGSAVRRLLLLHHSHLAVLVQASEETCVAKVLLLPPVFAAFVACVASVRLADAAVGSAAPAPAFGAPAIFASSRP